MDIKIDKLLTLAGNDNKYQYLTLIITFFIWVNVNILPISLAYLEKEPEVRYTNPRTGVTVEAQLNYTMCEDGPKNYNITETYGFSWIIEYEITCDRTTTGLIGSIVFLGDFVGSMSLNFFADKFGRKISFIIGLTVLILTLLSFTLSNSIIFIFIGCFLGGFSSTLTALSSYLLATESVSHNKRATFGAIINCAFSFAGIIYILLYLYTDSWRTVFIIAASLSTVFGIISLFILKESPGFFFSTGNYTKFMSSLKYIAKVNGRLELFEEQISIEQSEYKIIHDDIQFHLENFTIDYTFNKINRVNKVSDNQDFSGVENLLPPPSHIDTRTINKKKASALDLFRYPSIRYKFLILCFLWFCISGNYYGLSIFLKNLPGNIYINGIVIYIFEAFSYFFAGLVVNYKNVGRKGLMIIFYAIAIISFSILLFFNLSDFWTITTTFIGRFAVAGAFNLIYTYSIEIYPSRVRAFGLGINSSTARIAGVLFPILIEELAEYITILFVLMNIICCSFMFFMPETIGKTLRVNFKEEEEKSTEKTDL